MNFPASSSGKTAGSNPDNAGPNPAAGTKAQKLVELERLIEDGTLTEAQAERLGIGKLREEAFAEILVAEPSAVANVEVELEPGDNIEADAFLTRVASLYEQHGVSHVHLSIWRDWNASVFVRAAWGDVESDHTVGMESIESDVRAMALRMTCPPLQLVPKAKP